VWVGLQQTSVERKPYSVQSSHKDDAGGGGGEWTLAVYISLFFFLVLDKVKEPIAYTK
jgi:hypothetical protein